MAIQIIDNAMAAAKALADKAAEAAKVAAKKAADALADYVRDVFAGDVAPINGISEELAQEAGKLDSSIKILKKRLAVVEQAFKDAYPNGGRFDTPSGAHVTVTKVEDRFNPDFAKIIMKVVETHPEIGAEVETMKANPEFLKKTSGYLSVKE